MKGENTGSGDNFENRVNQMTGLLLEHPFALPGAPNFRAPNPNIFALSLVEQHIDLFVVLFVLIRCRSDSQTIKIAR
jgi:hypothetical protein